MKKLTTDELVKRFNIIHKNKFDYPLMICSNINSRIKIICPTHGEFKQRLSDHLYGHGCNLCAIDKNIALKRNNLQNLINRANMIHDNSYDYSLLNDHTSMQDIVDILCPKHGMFRKSMHSHINKKRGCKYCAIDKITDTKESFMIKSNKIHDNKYDYNKSVYVNSKTKLIITCPTHGDFSQRPMDHINSKQGCPVCNESKGERKIRIILKDLNINLISEKSFADLKHKRILFFDFYLPEHNVCIEFDGAQHFDPYIIFGGEESFDKIKIKDDLKNDYCKKNNIRLLRIPHTENDVKGVIKNFLKNDYLKCD